MRSATFTFKIVNADLNEFLHNEKLSESQKELIRFVARAAVQEYVREHRSESRKTEHDIMLRLPEVAKLSGLSRSTIYQYLKTGDFPKPLRLGERSVGWKKSRIEEWLDERAYEKKQ